MARSRDSDETAVNNRLQDIAEKGRQSGPQDDEPKEVGILNGNLRPVVFDVVKNIAITSTSSMGCKNMHTNTYHSTNTMHLYHRNPLPLLGRPLSRRAELQVAQDLGCRFRFPCRTIYVHHSPHRSSTRSICLNAELDAEPSWMDRSASIAFWV
jgi:hypothetical protein